MARTPWRDSKNMLVLTIGINKYQHTSKLSWAVADADAMESFFKNDIGVPPNRIIKLRNESATRENIIKAFHALRDHDSIAKDVPIVIYFAGHGTLVSSSNEGQVAKIQAICPQDVEVKDKPGRSVFPIPDYLLGSLINQLSKSQGNNITVIFDCCYSASGTRDLEDGQEGVRRIAFHGELPSNIDTDLTEGVRFQLISPGFLDQHSRSHVFLAACGANELAHESDGHGHFTKALLETLRKPGVGEISFIEFMKQMPYVKNQTPQCEGHFKDRILFKTQIPEMGLHFFRVVTGPDGHYKIEAGSIHSVTKDSLFDMFERAIPKSQFNKPTGTLRVVKVYPFSADAVLETNSEAMNPAVNPAFALQVRRGSGTALQVHFSSALLEEVRLCDVLSDVLNDEVVPVGKENADFIVNLKGTNAVFITNLDIIMKHGYEGKLPHDVEAKAEPISRVLLAACRWKHHLYSSPSRSYWRDQIDIEFFRLQHMEDEEGLALERNNSPKLNVGNEVVINVMPDELYGLEIKNLTKQQKGLHLSLLLFQIDNLSIEILHDPPIGTQSDGGADPSLPPNSSLQMGCGVSGSPPFAYQLLGIDVDVAILKLYLTTKPMSFKWLEQLSPFASATRHQITGDELKRRMKSPDHWDTVLFTVVQRSPVPSL